MPEKYKVKVNTKHEFEFTEAQIRNLDVQSLTSSTFHVLKDHRSYKAEITESDFLRKSYTVKVNSNLYEIIISGDLDQLIERMGLSLAATHVINDIKAPMPGLILDVQVQPGAIVKKGDFLLVLEAMKMENTLTAPRDGVVKSVSVSKGKTVEKNELLIEME